jgi:hypothetical protein
MVVALLAAVPAGAYGAHRHAKNCMPNPSRCGFPDVGKVGVQHGVKLKHVRGVVRLTRPGMVYKNRQVTGQILVEATNVTIRNVRLINTDENYAIAMLPFGRTTGNAHLEHVEINLGRIGDRTGGDLYGIAFNGYTANHVYFHNGSDCAGFGHNVVIKNSLCAVGPDHNGNGWPDGGHFVSSGYLNDDPSWCNSGNQHFDGFQSDGGSDIVLRHNTIRNPCSQTSAILMSSNTDPIGNIRIVHNLLAGGGYTLYCGGDTRSDRITNEVVTGNRIARTYWRKGGYYGPVAYCGNGYADRWGHNVWDSTSSPLPR